MRAPLGQEPQVRERQRVNFGGKSGPGKHEIWNPTSGEVVDLDRSDQQSVGQFSSRRTDNRIWEIRATGDGLYSFQSVTNGKALEGIDGNNSTQVQANRFASPGRWS